MSNCRKIILFIAHCLQTDIWTLLRSELSVLIAGVMMKEVTTICVSGIHFTSIIEVYTFKEIFRRFEAQGCF